MKAVKEIRSLAQEVLEHARIKEPPVAIERLARRLGVQLRYEPFDGDLSGMLYKEGEQIVIGVNALHPKTRQRFTIAHEIGHLLLHGYSGIHVDHGFPVRKRDNVSSQAIKTDEIEANGFAAELLMPATMLEDDVLELSLDYDDEELFRRLSDKYRVSLQAMIFRLTNLELIP